MKDTKSAKNRGQARKQARFLIARAVVAEMKAEAARKRAREAKAKFKAARRALKHAKKTARQARKAAARMFRADSNKAPNSQKTRQKTEAPARVAAPRSRRGHAASRG